MSITRTAAQLKLLPLVLGLANHLTENATAGLTFFGLWVFEEDGHVTIKSESDFAYMAGFTGQRAVRSWRACLMQLSSFGFTEAVRRDGDKVVEVCLTDPLLACTALHKKGVVPEEWWTAFLRQLIDLDLEIPTLSRPAIIHGKRRRQQPLGYPSVSKEPTS